MDVSDILKVYNQSPTHEMAEIIANSLDKFLTFDDFYKILPKNLYLIFDHCNEMKPKKVIAIIYNVAKYYDIDIEDFVSHFRTDKELVIRTVRIPLKEINNKNNMNDTLCIVENQTALIKKLRERIKKQDKKITDLTNKVEELSKTIEELSRKSKETTFVVESEFPSVLKRLFCINRNNGRMFISFQKAFKDMNQRMCKYEEDSQDLRTKYIELETCASLLSISIEKSQISETSKQQSKFINFMPELIGNPSDVSFLNTNHESLFNYSDISHNTRNDSLTKEVTEVEGIEENLDCVTEEDMQEIIKNIMEESEKVV